MASRALFNSQLTQIAKRPGVRYTSQFVAQREAVKHHAAGNIYIRVLLFFFPFFFNFSMGIPS